MFKANDVVMCVSKTPFWKFTVGHVYEVYQHPTMLEPAVMDDYIDAVLINAQSVASNFLLYNSQNFSAGSYMPPILPLGTTITPPDVPKGIAAAFCQEKPISQQCDCGGFKTYQTMAKEVHSSWCSSQK